MKIMELQLNGLIDQPLPDKVKSYSLVFKNEFVNSKLSNCFCNNGIVKYQNKIIKGACAVRKDRDLEIKFTVKALQFIRQHQIRKVVVDVKRKED